MKRFLAVCFLFYVIFPLTSGNAEEDRSEVEIRLDKAEIDQYNLPYIDKAFIDKHKLDELMDGLEDKLYLPPVNAKMESSGRIYPEKTGRALNREKFETVFTQHFYSDDQSKLTVPVRVVHPDVDGQLLKEISRNQLGSYSTFYRTGNKERATNVELATEAINSTVIFPGESFSFNEVVGERTEEKGYERAKVIVRGEFAEDIGGGICQVSSTLFNAVEIEGIQIQERYAHSREVPYVPPGRDATVSWWGPDFVFKNLYNEPLLILASAKHGRLTVSVYSSESAEYFSGEKRE